jgi:hypothetical protein
MRELGGGGPAERLLDLGVGDGQEGVDIAHQFLGGQTETALEPFDDPLKGRRGRLGVVKSIGNGFQKGFEIGRRSSDARLLLQTSEWA